MTSPKLGGNCPKSYRNCILSYDWSGHIQESWGPLGPKSPKSLRKVFPGLRARSVKKVSKKCQMTWKRVKRLQNQCSGTFSTLFWHSGRGGPGSPFWDFLGISGLGGVDTPVYGDCTRKFYPSSFSPFLGQFSGRSGEGICAIFSRFFGRFRPGQFPASVREKLHNARNFRLPWRKMPSSPCGAICNTEVTTTWKIRAVKDLGTSELFRE